VKLKSYLVDNGGLETVPEVPAAEANIEAEAASRDQPLLGNDVPVAQVTAHQLEADSLLLAGLEVDLLETAELADRSAFRSGRGKADVKFCCVKVSMSSRRAGMVVLTGNSGTGNLSRVGNGSVDSVNSLPESGVATGDDGEVLRLRGDGVDRRRSADAGCVESGVGKTEAKLVADGDVLSVEVTVVDLKLLIEVGLPVVNASGVDGGGRGSVVVSAVEGDSIREMSRGIHGAIKDVNNGVTGLLTGEVSSDNSSDVRVVSEGQEVDARGVGDDNGVVAS
jgi:hypothetical protein